MTILRVTNCKRKILIIDLIQLHQHYHYVTIIFEESHNIITTFLDNKNVVSSSSINLTRFINAANQEL